MGISRKKQSDENVMISEKACREGHTYLPQSDREDVSVSIIVPVYKVEMHIERCLRSVFRQDDYEGNIECILVDDCSPDNSMDIACRLLSEYSGKIRFRILCHEQNCGLSAARNTGTSAAEGDYLFYLDSDDEIMPGAVVVLVDSVVKYPGVDVVCGDWYVCRKHRELQNDPWLNEYLDNRNEIVRTLLTRVSMTATNKLFRTGFIRQNALHFRDGIYHEDELFNYFMAEAAESIAISFFPTYLYYLNSCGITAQAYNDKRFSDLIDISEEILSRGQTLYKYVTCLRLVEAIYRGLNEMSPELPRFRKLMHKLYRTAFKGGLYKYSFYLYRFYRASFKRPKVLMDSMSYNKEYTRTLRKVRRMEKAR